MGWRSVLVLSAAAENLAAALGADADAIAIDLDPARDLASAALAERVRHLREAISTAPRPPAVMVQIACRDTRRIETDLDAAMAARPAAILLPYCESVEALGRLAAKLAVREAEYDIPAGLTRIVAVTGSSAKGVLALPRFAGASARLAALAWDAAALAADLGIAPDNEAPEPYGAASPLAAARSLTVLAARAAGVTALDGGSNRHGAAFDDECRRARRDGFAGKMTRHYAQVASINAIFATIETSVADRGACDEPERGSQI